MNGEQNLQLLQLLREYLEEGSEPHQVAEYCLSSIAVVKAALAANHNPTLKEIPVPPEAIILLNDYQSGVVNNSFYHKYFSAITTMMTMENVRANSLSNHLIRSAKGDGDSKGIVRELQAQRFEVLSMIVFWDKGISKAKEFDFMLRKITKLSDQEKRYFKKHGVV